MVSDPKSKAIFIQAVNHYSPRDVKKQNLKGHAWKIFLQGNLDNNSPVTIETKSEVENKHTLLPPYTFTSCNYCLVNTSIILQ